MGAIMFTGKIADELASSDLCEAWAPEMTF